MWSDGCSYQNHTACVADAYSESARKYGVLITQKYLLAGHTQMECVSMHFNPIFYLQPKRLCHYTPNCKNQAFSLTCERAQAE